MTEGEVEFYRGRVEPTWIDWNGHMNLAFYVLAIDRAVDGFCDAVGLDAALRDRTQQSIFAAEIHVGYRRELLLGEAIHVTLQIVDLDAKGIHWFWRLYRSDSGDLAAWMEGVTLSVDLRTRRVAPWHADVWPRIDALWQRQRHLPSPPQLGRVMGLRRKQRSATP